MLCSGHNATSIRSFNFLPYTISQSNFVVYDKGIALKSMATSGNFVTQFFYYACIYNSCSIVQFIISAIPSVWGCKAILKVSIVFNKEFNSSQKWPHKQGSWSLIIYSRSPCWLTTILKNLSAMVRASDSHNGTTCAILLKWFTHVTTTVCPSSSSSLEMK